LLKVKGDAIIRVTRHLGGVFRHGLLLMLKIECKFFWAQKSTTLPHGRIMILFFGIGCSRRMLDSFTVLGSRKYPFPSKYIVALLANKPSLAWPLLAVQLMGGLVALVIPFCLWVGLIILLNAPATPAHWYRWPLMVAVGAGSLVCGNMVLMMP
jgi:hypothetical protein